MGIVIPSVTAAPGFDGCCNRERRSEMGSFASCLTRVFGSLVGNGRS